MRWKRARVRYSETPSPQTPYQKAAQVWDERLGSARVQAANWRLMAFGTLGLSVIMAGALAWRSGQSLVTPYVVEVDRSGQVRAVGEALTPYQPSDAQMAYHLAEFIQRVRSLSIDPVIVRQNWLRAYDYTTDKGAATLNAFARQNDPFAQVGRKSVSVEVTSVVRASESSFQVRWLERHFDSGALVAQERWTGVLTVVQQPPRDEARLRKNPLGIYINGLSWSRELGSADSSDMSSTVLE